MIFLFFIVVFIVVLPLLVLICTLFITNLPAYCDVISDDISRVEMELFGVSFSSIFYILISGTLGVTLYLINSIRNCEKESNLDGDNHA